MPLPDGSVSPETSPPDVQAFLDELSLERRRLEQVNDQLRLLNRLAMRFGSTLDTGILGSIVAEELSLAFPGATGAVLGLAEGPSLARVGTAVPPSHREAAVRLAAGEPPGPFVRPLLRRLGEEGATLASAGWLVPRSLPTPPGIRQFLEAVALSLEPALHNALQYAQARDMALRDPLTGVYNRRAFQDLLHSEHERSVRYRDDLALLMLDIDHFKPVNDTYGHAAGDEVLARVARSLEANARACDLVARYGGDEFALIAPGTDRNAARSLGQRLCTAVRRLSFDVVPGLALSISVGISDRAPGDRASCLLEAADSALLGAKQRGRDRVVVAPGLRLTPLPGGHAEGGQAGEAAPRTVRRGPPAARAGLAIRMARRRDSA